MPYKLILFLFLFTGLSSRAQHSTINSQKNLPDGYHEKRYPNGEICYKGNFKDGHPTDTLWRYYENGKIRAVMIFSNQGKKAQAKMYNSKGEFKAQGNFWNTKKDSTWIYYGQKKSVRAVENYQKGVKHGSFTYYFKDGELAQQINWDKGFKHGAWIRYFPNGKIFIRANYQKGKLDGKYKSYTPQGITDAEGTFKNNLRDHIWKFNMSQNQIRIEYKDGKALNKDKLDKQQQIEMQQQEAKSHLLDDPEKYISNPDLFISKQMRH